MNGASIEAVAVPHLIRLSQSIIPSWSPNMALLMVADSARNGNKPTMNVSNMTVGIRGVTSIFDTILKIEMLPNAQALIGRHMICAEIEVSIISANTLVF